MRRLRRHGSLSDFLNRASFWALLAIIVLEMIRLIFRPSGIDAIILVLSMLVFLSTVR
ncbi:MAG: hypothetical protein ACOX18_01285 [Bacillota bacterium]|jgi:hypothetical protein